MKHIIKIHAGCGPHIFQDWINYDLAPGPGGVAHNLEAGIPYRQAVAFIFSEHFIEHLTRDRGQAFLKSCYEALQPGGVLRISTPDLKSIMNDYRMKKTDRYAPTWSPTSPARFVNEGLRAWGHQFVYDQDELVEALTTAGFALKNITSEKWHRSQHEELANREVRPYRNDIILEAKKE